MLLASAAVRGQMEKKLFRSFDVAKSHELEIGEVQSLTETLCQDAGVAPPPSEKTSTIGFTQP